MSLTTIALGWDVFPYFPVNRGFRSVTQSQSGACFGQRSDGLEPSRWTEALPSAEALLLSPGSRPDEPCEFCWELFGCLLAGTSRCYSPSGEYQFAGQWNLRRGVNWQTLLLAGGAARGWPGPPRLEQRAPSAGSFSRLLGCPRGTRVTLVFCPLDTTVIQSCFLKNSSVGFPL